MTTDITTDFHLDLPVAAPAATLRSAIDDVAGWWTTDLDHDGAELTVRFGANWTRLRIDGEQWTVTGMDTPALPVADEWVGDVLRFTAEDAGDGTSVLRFTHHGLLAQACVSECRPAWQHYLASLVALAETGEGRPWRPGQEATGG